MPQIKIWLLWFKATQNRWYAKPLEEGPREGSFEVVKKSDYDVCRDRLESEVNSHANTFYHWHESIKKVDKLKQQIEELKRERDLAIAHDAQPYPTSHAYEKTCEARDKLREENTELKTYIKGKDDLCTDLSMRLSHSAALIEQLRDALKDLGLKCVNSGMYGPLKISPGKCECSTCRARKVLAHAGGVR